MDSGYIIWLNNIRQISVIKTNEKQKYPKHQWPVEREKRVKASP